MRTRAAVLFMWLSLLSLCHLKELYPKTKRVGERALDVVAPGGLSKAMLFNVGEVLFYGLPGGGGDMVLEMGQFGDDVGGQQVGAGGYYLAQFDKGWP